MLLCLIERKKEILSCNEAPEFILVLSVNVFLCYGRVFNSNIFFKDMIFNVMGCNVSLMNHLILSKSHM